jgi:hypothetical protein
MSAISFLMIAESGKTVSPRETRKVSAIILIIDNKILLKLSME